jgi:hypothetical protein
MLIWKGFFTMKIHSNRFNQTFEVNAYQSTNERGDEVLIIYHRSLQRLGYEIMATNPNFKVSYKDVATNPKYCVVRCNISDGKIDVEEVGETTPETLENDISKMYPCTLANNRAYDKALIRYLDIPGKVYSDLEGVKPQQQPSPNQTQTSNRGQGYKRQQPQSQPQPQQQQTQEQPQEFKFKSGKYKGKTIPEVYNLDPQYIEWASKQRFDSATPCENFLKKGNNNEK